MFRFLLLLVPVLLIVSCGGNPPAPVTTSEYLKSMDARFVQENGYPRYSLKLRVLKDIPRYAWFRVSYENPEDPAQPWIAKAWPEDGMLVLKSRSIDAIKMNTTYLVKIELVEEDEVLSVHRQYIRYVLTDRDRESFRADLIF